MLDFVKNKLRKISRLDEQDLIETVFENQGVKQLMIELNQVQMESKGVDSHDETLGNYSSVSVQKYGKEPGHIKLYDTGEFYNSMKVVTESHGQGAIITGDMVKPDRDLEIQWPYALGLDKDSLSEVRDVAKEIIIDEIKKDFSA